MIEVKIKYYTDKLKYYAMHLCCCCFGELTGFITTAVHTVQLEKSEFERNSRAKVSKSSLGQPILLDGGNVIREKRD